ncbi:hypothetical protein ACTFIY_007311 [Dictyostelium cf. discoideum]
MQLLQYFLFFVGCFRLFCSFKILTNPVSIFGYAYPNVKKEVFLGLFSRIAFLWFFTTGSMTIACSQDIENKSLFFLTWMTFVYGLGHHIVEYLYFRTTEIKNNLVQFSLASPLIIIMGSIMISW